MPGVATSTFALLPVSASGAITITNHSTSANVLVDVAGWTSSGDVTADAGPRPSRRCGFWTPARTAAARRPWEAAGRSA